MKKIIILSVLFLLLIMGCSSPDNDEIINGNNRPIGGLIDIPYGTDPFQKMDIYLPASPNPDTKVFVLLHGGAWKFGSKEDINWLVTLLSQHFPDYAIVNMNYRLATDGSPGFPKQTDDITSALQFLQDRDYNISHNYAFIGMSAGAHLSMLYGYKYNASGNVKVICSIVGPTDFTDPAYDNHDFYTVATTSLLGTPTPSLQQIMQVNPYSHISQQSPPTLMLYGGQDPIIPVSQGDRLHARLNAYGIYNKYVVYPLKAHDGWDTETALDVYDKLVTFMQEHF